MVGPRCNRIVPLEVDTCDDFKSVSLSGPLRSTGILTESSSTSEIASPLIKLVKIDRISGNPILHKPNLLADIQHEAVHLISLISALVVGILCATVGLLFNHHILSSLFHSHMHVFALLFVLGCSGYHFSCIFVFISGTSNLSRRRIIVGSIGGFLTPVMILILPVIAFTSIGFHVFWLFILSNFAQFNIWKWSFGKEGKPALAKYAILLCLVLAVFGVICPLYIYLASMIEDVIVQILAFGTLFPMTMAFNQHVIAPSLCKHAGEWIGFDSEGATEFFKSFLTIFKVVPAMQGFFVLYFGIRDLGAFTLAIGTGFISELVPPLIALVAQRYKRLEKILPDRLSLFKGSEHGQQEWGQEKAVLLCIEEVAEVYSFVASSFMSALI